jgi:hypothetical protein
MMLLAQSKDREWQDRRTLGVQKKESNPSHLPNRRLASSPVILVGVLMMGMTEHLAGCHLSPVVRMTVTGVGKAVWVRDLGQGVCFQVSPTGVFRAPPSYQAWHLPHVSGTS